MIGILWAGGFLHLVTVVTAIPFIDSPYNPSYIWIPTANVSSHGYVLSAGASASDTLRLQSIGLSTNFETETSPLHDISSPIPFLHGDGKGNAVVPVTDSDGLPMLYIGDCHSQKYEVWKFLPGPDEAEPEGDWKRLSVNRDQDSTVNGPNFLASAVAFSPEMQNSSSDIYVFGGMCPRTSEADEQPWLSSADYSRNMTLLKANGPQDDSAYEATVLPMRTPPVPEAGFSLTPLLPAYTNSSAGKQFSQQSFVMIGGHTDQAFINMSQIALLSLPETSWSYIPVQQPPLDLLISRLGHNDITGVEPRSGHTAVLSPDGSKIVVFGGWVGDTTVPAEPQLVVLRLGEGYGSSNGWRWDIPEQQSPYGLPSDAGIFGHGAGMLRGGVMLIAGGYQIPSEPTLDSETPVPNNRVYLFNTTSETWLGSYDPLVPIIEPSPTHGSGPLSSPGQKAGLGVGLGVGVFAIATVIVCLYCYRTRHSRQHRKFREQELRRLALGAERPHFHVNDDDFHPPMAQARAEHSPFVSAPDHDAGFAAHADGQHSPSRSTAERTGLLVETQIRGTTSHYGGPSRSYKPSPFVGGLQRFSGIHPIDESEEYDAVPQEEPDHGDASRGSRHSVLFDPFVEPPSPVKRSLAPPILPDMPFFSHRDRGYSQVDLGSDGRRSTSPDKSSRTLSNLSDGSSGSGVSMASLSSNPQALLGRPESQGSISYHSRHNNLGQRSQDSICYGYERLYSNSQLGGRGLSASMADPNHPSEPLLFGSDFSPTRYQGGGGQSLMGQGAAWLSQPQSSILKPSNGPKTKALEWAGTVRRAFGSLRSTEVTARPHSVAPEGTLGTNSAQRSSSSSPTKSFYSAPEDKPTTDASAENMAMPAAKPLRAMSTSSSMFRRKQGARDWDVGKRMSGDSSALLRIRAFADTPTSERSAAGSRGTDSPDFVVEAGFHDGYDDVDNDDDDDDWDVEAAAEGRVVQVTFTVPKEKLRVVNAGVGDQIDDDEEEGPNNMSRDDQVHATANG